MKASTYSFNAAQQSILCEATEYLIEIGNKPATSCLPASRRNIKGGGDCGGGVLFTTPHRTDPCVGGGSVGAVGRPFSKKGSFQYVCGFLAL
ncbi:hypothetical protein CDAR_565631 [Caerostris darwini]|uniref:Uncharacterized protein n=1 Tax=Caerostris darwini TaxID=1538125 RepID=A0AAV4UYV1_9ARAC|nr:hypothetical protein CDAR_565631 [Caerostris darwini]